MKRLKIKIFFSYLTFIVLIAVGAYLLKTEILSSKNKLENNNSSNQVVREINNILNKLYTAEAINKAPNSHYNKTLQLKHKQLTDSIVSSINALQSTTIDSVLTLQFDSIKDLLGTKQKQLKQLSLYRSPNSIDSLYFRTIQRLDTKQDSLPYNIEITENKSVQYDSVYLKTAYTPTATKNFWGRSKPQQTIYDSTLQVTVSKNFVMDSLVNKVETNDSIGNLLKEIISEFRTEIINVEEQQKAKKDIIYNNYKDISSNISQLINNIKQEQLNISTQQIEQQKIELDKSFQHLYILGLIALLIIIIFVINILRDITKSQRYKNDLEKANSTIESVLKEKEMMMHSLSHDIKSPISSIIGYANILAENNNSKKEQNYLQNINQQSVYINKLIEDLHILSKLEQGKLKPNSTNIKLSELISEVYDSHKRIAESKNIAFYNKLNINTNKHYFTDDVRLKQILNNIISNAVKYTNKGLVNIKTDIIESKHNSDLVCISITDTGIGMDSEELKNLFEPFNRGKKEGQKYEGIGLGLSTTKHLLKLLNATIKVDSTVNKGSKFTITLRLQHAPIKEAKAPIEKCYNLKNKTIWLVDDDETLLEMMAASLKKTEASICCYSNPLTALKNYNNNCFDILITDIQMPQLNGNLLLKKINELSNKPVITIATTGLELDSTLFDAKDFYAVIKKPFLPKQLQEIIHKALNIEQKELSNTPKTKVGSLQPLLAFAEENKELENVITDSFFSNEEANIKLFNTYIEGKDFKNIAHISHKMLNVYRQIKCIDIIHNLEILENLPEDKPNAISYLIVAQTTLNKIKTCINSIREEYADCFETT